MPQLKIWITYFFMEHNTNKILCFFFQMKHFFSVKNWIMCSKTKAQKFLIYRFFKIVGNTCFQWWDVRTYVRTCMISSFREWNLYAKGQKGCRKLGRKWTTKLLASKQQDWRWSLSISVKYPFMLPMLLHTPCNKIDSALKKQHLFL